MGETEQHEPPSTATVGTPLGALVRPLHHQPPQRVLEGEGLLGLAHTLQFMSYVHVEHCSVQLCSLTLGIG